MKLLRRLLPLSLVALALLTLAPAALAQSPTGDAYGTPDGRTVTEVGGVNQTSPTSPSSQAAPAAASEAPQPAAVRSLPFTGLDLGVVALGGGVLLLVGVGLRRATRREQLSA